MSIVRYGTLIIQYFNYTKRNYCIVMVLHKNCIVLILNCIIVSISYRAPEVTLVCSHKLARCGNESMHGNDITTAWEQVINAWERVINAWERVINARE